MKRSRDRAAQVTITAYEQFVERLRNACARVASGDLEARLASLDGDAAAAPNLQAARNELNRVFDRIDAFIRESSASLQSAVDGRFYRQFLVAGMPGSFGAAARQINSAREDMGASDAQTREAAAERQALAGSFEETVMSVAEQVAAAATELSASAAGLASSARSAVNEADRARSTVASLEEQSRQIEDVVTVISRVAAQTKLLALNATIEAARAGEAGKGFAVVASEVKELADQTGRATSDITQLVQSVQSVATESFTVMESIGDTVREMGSLTEGVAVAVDGNEVGQYGGGAGLAQMTEMLRSESDRFLSAIRNA